MPRSIFAEIMSQQSCYFPNFHFELMVSIFLWGVHDIIYVNNTSIHEVGKNTLSESSHFWMKLVNGCVSGSLKDCTKSIYMLEAGSLEIVKIT